MTTSRITAPASKNLPGEFTSVYGSTSITFIDGVATVEDLPDGIRHYLLSAGYNVDGEQAEPQAVPAPIDARDATGVQVGGPLRDAAVDPRADDFLPPVNAGQADPHGPLVVAPGIHAEGERAVRPGPVSSDPAQQTADEQETAEALLIDNKPAGDAVALAVPDRKDTGPLDLSDPGSAAAAHVGRTGDDVQPAGDGHQDDGQPQSTDVLADGEEPKGNATREAWAKFAESKGATPEDLEGKSRDDIRAAYGS